MTGDGKVKWLDVAGKPVAVIEDHHHALLPWAQWRRHHDSLRLITVDHHCDTMDAFLRAAYDGRQGTDIARQSALIGAIDWSRDAAMEAAIAPLRHDEHIDAAIRSGIIDAAFIVHEQDDRAVRSVEETAFWEKARVLRKDDPAAEFVFLRTAPRPVPPMTYHMPMDRMMAIHPTWYCEGATRIEPWPDRAIESDHLDNRLAIFEGVLQLSAELPLEASPYILDIDMDAFNTVKALNPADPSTLHRLIAGAVGITIARERDCCDILWKDGHPRDDEANFAIVLDHVAAAMTRWRSGR